MAKLLRRRRSRRTRHGRPFVRTSRHACRSSSVNVSNPVPPAPMNSTGTAAPTGTPRDNADSTSARNSSAACACSSLDRLTVIPATRTTRRTPAPAAPALSGQLARVACPPGPPARCEHGRSARRRCPAAACDRPARPRAATGCRRAMICWRSRAGHRTGHQRRGAAGPRTRFRALPVRRVGRHPRRWRARSWPGGSPRRRA